jgi:prepilin-type N-terminal cleavage/methylation domain-containing protein
VRKVGIGNGFTLIELLIVIAIILILISIALPNFLTAQERARVGRAKANLRTIETGATSHQAVFNFVYADYNDPQSVRIKTRNKSSPILNVPCPLNPPLIRSKGGLSFIGDAPSAVGDMQRTYHAPDMHCPLTTPIKFVVPAALIDPWSDGSVPVGYDTRYFGTGGSDDVKLIRLAAYFVSGPDRVAGHRQLGGSATGGCPAWSGKALPYAPTNGTVSCGDLWLVIALDRNQARMEYDPLRSF